ITAGNDIDLELRTALRQGGSAVTGDVRVIVPNETSGWATPGQLHHFHFRGDDVAGSRDPNPTGLSGLLDPAIYTADSGTDVAINSYYHFELQHPKRPRTDELILGTTLNKYTAVIVNGDYSLYDDSTSAPAESPGLTAGNHITVRDTEALANG